MLAFVSVIHVILCSFMIFVILLQPGKDAGMGSALGGGAATSAFGGRGAVTFLSKVTAICASLFFLTSLGLSFVGTRTSIADRAAAADLAKKQEPGKVPPPAASTATLPDPSAPASTSPLVPVAPHAPEAPLPPAPTH